MIAFADERFYLRFRQQIRDTSQSLGQKIPSSTKVLRQPEDALRSHSAEYPVYKRKVGGPRQPDIPRKERPCRLGHRRNLPTPTQLARFYSMISTHHNTTTAPIPLHLGSQHGLLCICNWALDRGPGRGLSVAVKSGISKQRITPCPGPWQQCPLPIGDPSIARPAWSP